MTLKKTNKSLKPEQIWMTIFIVLPIGLLFPTAEFFDVSGSTRVLISGVLGGIGGLIGFVFYSIFKSTNTFVKATVLTSIFAFGITCIYLINSYNSSVTTCEICGYIAIERNAIDCQNCGSYTWENENEFGDYANKKDWLVEEQLYYFSYPGFQKTDFFTPEFQDGFLKDENWTPSITELEVNKYLTD